MEDKVIISTEKYEELVEKAVKAELIESYAFTHSSDWDIGVFVLAVFDIVKAKGNE